VKTLDDQHIFAFTPPWSVNYFGLPKTRHNLDEFEKRALKPLKKLRFNLFPINIFREGDPDHLAIVAEPSTKTPEPGHSSRTALIDSGGAIA